MNLGVMGLQWGDEGKGKAIDFLAADFDVVVRYQGGHNAGHTIYRDKKKIVLHLLPSGIFSEKTISVIGNGVVVNPVELVREMKDVSRSGVSLKNLAISSTAPLILPFHQVLDTLFERTGITGIGTTKRGIGPAYEDVSGRRSLFIHDLYDEIVFEEKVKKLEKYYNGIIEHFGGEKVDIDFIEDYLAAGREIEPNVVDTVEYLNKLNSDGKTILFEGAQGTLLDINFGSFPFVTSSNPSVGGIFTGTGLSHKTLNKVIGVTKAYTTRVGSGPFPSELKDSKGEYLRQKGQEFGATTGRPRRVGWLDLVALKYSVEINGVDSLFLTKLDVLDELDDVGVVTSYGSGKEKMRFFPHSGYLDSVVTDITLVKGWKTNTSSIRSWTNFPENVKNYIKCIEDYTGIPVEFVSCGPEREQTIVRSL